MELEALLIKIYARQTCGCCIYEMQFKDIESANKAFSKHGHVSITDDAGVTYGSADTFYGFSMDKKEQQQKGLGYLFRLVEGIEGKDV